MTDYDTIFSLASGAGTAGVAVIRLSGPAAYQALLSLTDSSSYQPRQACFRRLICPVHQVVLDEAIVIYFQAPHSFTGEDVVELHLHGGRAVIDGVLESLSLIDGLRLAEAGEYTRRAFENGKMDLTRVEALSDLLQAQTLAQKTQALRQLDGAFAAQVETWRQHLLSCCAYIEADIDFPDEDVVDNAVALMRADVRKLEMKMRDYLDDGRQGQMLREGLRIAIIGQPNVGKSTLMNALARSDVAITSSEAGTTRDILDIQLDWGGFLVRFIDTAGLRNAAEEEINAVEQEGIRRALEQAERADLKLILVRADHDPLIADHVLSWCDDRSFLLVTQIDRLSDPQTVFHVKQDHMLPPLAGQFALSVHSGVGMDCFYSAMQRYVEKVMGQREAPALTRARHRKILENCVEHLARYNDNALIDNVLAAEDIRMAVRVLGQITGRVGVEDMLDVIFAEFCIGK